MIGKNKKDFIGKRSLSRSDTSRSDRKQLVGVLTLDRGKSIEEGQHVIEQNTLPRNINKPVDYLGHITSSYYSPTLNRYIAMGLLKNGNRLIGKKLYVSKSSGVENTEVEIVKPIFLDPENKRLLS